MINIIPIDDLKEHTENNSCACSPSIIFENEEMIVIHNAYDGRQFKEELINNISQN